MSKTKEYLMDKERHEQEMVQLEAEFLHNLEELKVSAWESISRCTRDTKVVMNKYGKRKLLFFYTGRWITSDDYLEYRLIEIEKIAKETLDNGIL